jgi:hypothetical protein
VLKISPPPGFDPRTVQPVASSYTDYAIPALTFIQLLYPEELPSLSYELSECTNKFCSIDISEYESDKKRVDEMYLGCMFLSILVQ